MTRPARATVDVAFDECVRALDEPAFSHLLGLGMSLGKCVRFGGPAVDRVTNLFSVTKSIVAIGIREAVRNGIFGSYQDRLQVVQQQPSPRIGDLLDMRQSWRFEPDMDAIERRACDPLEDIVESLRTGSCGGWYVNAGPHLLMRELQHRTGSALRFLHRSVLGPAGVSRYHWDLDEIGVPWGHAHLHLSVRELVKLGAWCLQQGLAKVEPEGATAAMPPERLPYRNGFWVGADYVMAAGWGGQCLVILPAEGAVLAALGNTGWDRKANCHNLNSGWRPGRQLFESRLLPALRFQQGEAWNGMSSHKQERR